MSTVRTARITSRTTTVKEAKKKAREKRRARRIKKQPEAKEGYDNLTPKIQRTKNRELGRPFITMESLSPLWKDIMINLASRGYSDVEIRAELCMVDSENKAEGKFRTFSMKRWNRLQELSEDFSQTYKICRVLCEAWWMMKGRKGIDTSFFNTAVWFINMKNRFGWKDKQEIQMNIKKTLADQISKGRQRVLDAIANKPSKN